MFIYICTHGEKCKQIYKRLRTVSMRVFLKNVRLVMAKTKKCSKGEIMRKSYIRTLKNGRQIHVPEQCIQDRGLPGTGFIGIGPLRKGELTKYGYQHVNNLTISQRRTALRKAIREYGSLGVWRKLNAVAVYTKRTSPQTSRIFKEDMAWIRSEFGIKAF